VFTGTLEVDPAFVEAVMRMRGMGFFMPCERKQLFLE
jgi:hypothetical protein